MLGHRFGRISPERDLIRHDSARSYHTCRHFLASPARLGTNRRAARRLFKLAVLWAAFSSHWVLWRSERTLFDEHRTDRQRWGCVSLPCKHRPARLLEAFGPRSPGACHCRRGRWQTTLGGSMRIATLTDALSQPRLYERLWALSPAEAGTADARVGRTCDAQ